MHTQTLTRTRVHTCAHCGHTHTLTHGYIYRHTHIWTHAHTRTRGHTHGHTHTCTHARTCRYIHRHTCTQTHTLMHGHTHTETHIHGNTRTHMHRKHMETHTETHAHTGKHTHTLTMCSDVARLRKVESPHVPLDPEPYCVCPQQAPAPTQVNLNPLFRPDGRLACGLPPVGRFSKKP